MHTHDHSTAIHSSQRAQMSLTGGMVNKMGNVYSMTRYSAVRRNEILVYAYNTDRLLGHDSGGKTSHETTHCMIPLIGKIQDR